MEENNLKPGDVVTEVTSIAMEQDKGGEVTIPSPEELRRNAAISFRSSMKKFNALFANLSVRGKMRVMNAVLELPADNLLVGLKGDAEKLAFGLGQRALSDRFILTYYHIVEERKNQISAKVSEESTDKEV